MKSEKQKILEKMAELDLDVLKKHMMEKENTYSRDNLEKKQQH